MKIILAIFLLSSVAFAAPKKIIILNSTKTAGQVTIDYLFWLYPVTPKAAQPPSVWTGASNAENNALAAGNVIEEQHSQAFLTDGNYVKDIRQGLVAKYNERDNVFRLSISSKTFYGSYYDDNWNTP